MKPFRWSSNKNETLRQERGITFEVITVAVEAGHPLDVLIHPHPRKYPRQKIVVVDVAGYAHLVPFVEEEDHSVCTPAQSSIARELCGST